MAEALKDLARLESGEMRLGERKVVGGLWRDITEQWIKHYKHTIGTFEAILAALNKKEPL